MEEMREETVESEFVYRGRIINLRLDKVRLSDGRETLREIVEHPGAAAVVPILPDGKVVLVRQYRKAVEEVLLEIPAGKLEEGESPEVCVMRELEEETGFRAGKIRRILEYFPSPGFSDECIHLFEATELQEGRKNLQPDELMETVSLSVSEIAKLIKEGKIKDSKTIIGVLTAAGESLAKQRDSSLRSE